MSSQVVRVQGFSKGSLGAIGKEVEREEKEILQHRNPDIDIERTHLNEIYKQTKNGMYGEWKDTCKALNVSNADHLKKNAIAFEGMIVTSDKEFFEKMGYVQGQKPPQKVKEFFDQAYDFAKQEIGFKGTDKNILSAVIHYDETTPHLQLYYIPVVDSWKEKVLQKDENGKVLKNEKGSPLQARDDNGKLVWNTVTDSEVRKLSRDSFWKNKGGNTSYTQMQDRFYEQISKEYGLGRGEKGSTRQHTTKAEWEQEKINKEIVSVRKELTAHQKEVGKLRSQLEYAKDGSVAIPQLAGKTKTAEIQEQNKALRLEVNELISKNNTLKAENEQLKKQEQARADALKDRHSPVRMSLDALDSQTIYRAYMEQYSLKIKGLEEAMKPYENMVAQAHAYGQKMVEHKEQYVICLESRKSAQNDIQLVQANKSTLTTDLGQIKAIEEDLNTVLLQLEELEQERNEYSTLQILKKLDCDKQIKDCREKIKSYEETLETKYDMKNRTDHVSIADEIRWYKNEIKKCTHEINEKSLQVDNLTEQAKNHLQNYKIMQKAKEGLNEPVKNIVDRYDEEYQPLQQHKLALEPYTRDGLPKTKIQERENTRKTFDEWKVLVNHSRAEQMTKEAPQIYTRVKDLDYYPEQ